MLFKLNHFPKDRGENKKSLKPPPTGGGAKSTHLVKSQPTAWAQGFREKSTQSGKVNPKSTKPNGHTRIGHVLEAVHFTQEYAHTAEF